MSPFVSDNMDKELEQSSDSIATSDEFEVVGTLGDVDVDQKHNERNNGIAKNKVLMVDKPITLDFVQIKDNSIEKNDIDEKHIEKMNGKGLKLERVTRHPLASPHPDSEATLMENGISIQTQEDNEKPLQEKFQLLGASSPEEEVSQSSSFQFGVTDCSLFPEIKYLGCAAINAPRSEKEIQRNMSILNDQPLDHAIEIVLSVPSHSEGAVILLESDSNNEIASFSIHRILFCARGLPDSHEKECFAFACSHGNTAETAIFQCHVFKCDSPETVVKLLQTFKVAFSRLPKLNLSRGDSISSDKGAPIGMSIKNYQQVFIYDTTVDMKEEDLKGNFVSCPREKDYFKLRCDLEKMITVTVNQTSNNKELLLQRCFGLLVSPGRNLGHADMHILEGVVINRVLSADKALYHISANWNPTESVFEIINTVTPRDHLVYFTVAVDLVFAGIEEPVRFMIETKAKIFAQNERFWNLTRKVLHEQFYLRVKEIDTEVDKDLQYEVLSLWSASQRKQPHLWQVHQQGSRLSITSQLDQELESGNDDPMPSGTGEVSKECSEGELEGWGEVLSKWRLNLKQRPKQLSTLVRKGVPEALRGEIWPLLAGCTNDKEMVDTYRNLISKDSAWGNVIQRDINRTFPAHEFFRESGGTGQDSLYKICKAYSVHDTEIGYCQGQSFLAAALLLHMPEEQAFSILVKIMYEYGLRDFFKNGFEELHLRLYQLEKLIEDQLPELFAHFVDLGIEAHMFASQWFLTLFTAKFPLFVVFHILDIFLLDGLDILFQVGLALLRLSKRDLLALDFEGVLKYFRVSLPKKYRQEDNARLLLATATSLKIKKLKKFAKDFLVLKEQQKQLEDPVEKLQKENNRLQLNNMRLEHENDDLANELITLKSQLGSELKNTQDKLQICNKELISAKKSIVELGEEKQRLETEVTQLKELCRRELQQAEVEINRNNSIISEYKQICNQLNLRLEIEHQLLEEYTEKVKNKVSSCEACCKSLFSKEDTTACIEYASPKSDDLLEAEKQVRELELELAQTKLALVEAECKNQDLNHRLNSVLADLQTSKNTWLQKTWTSIKDVTKKEGNPSNELKDTL